MTVLFHRRAGQLLMVDCGLWRITEYHQRISAAALFRQHAGTNDNLIWSALSRFNIIMTSYIQSQSHAMPGFKTEMYQSYLNTAARSGDCTRVKARSDH
jgi:hypothetical protein